MNGAEHIMYAKPHRKPDRRLKPLNLYKPTDFRRVLISKKMKSLRDFSLSTKRSISVKSRDYSQRCALSVGTQMAGSNIDALRLAIQDLGFNEVTNEHDRDITWNGAFFYKNDRKRKGFVNKFPGIHCLLTKISLFSCLELQRCLFPESYNFYPPTWFLPYQYEKWISYIGQQTPGCTTYIVKPSGGTQGKGIYLVQSPQEYCDHQIQTVLETPIHLQKKLPLSSSSGGSGPWVDPFGFLAAKEVIQRYEDHPALVGGFKADLRIYVVLESLSPLRIHIYRDGLVRLASQRYEAPDPINIHKTKMHLTNYSINKFPDSCDIAQPISDDESYGSGCSGDSGQLEKTPVWQCKRRLCHFLHDPNDNNHYRKTHGASRRSNATSSIDSGWKLDAKQFWTKVDELVRNTIFALIPNLRVAYWAECSRMARTKGDVHIIKPSPQCFQIFGFDLLLVEPDYRPVLLEVNSSPSLRIDCMRPLVRMANPKHPVNPLIVNSPKYAAFARSRVDEIVKTGLLRATLSLIGSRLLFDRMSSESMEKAYAFLSACGYKTPSSPHCDPKAMPEIQENDNCEKKDDEKSAPINKPTFPQLTLSPTLRCDNGKASKRTTVPASLGCHWMCDRIAQFYELDANTGKPIQTPSLGANIDAHIDDLVQKHAGDTSWPPFRRRTLSAIYGRQSVNERLTSTFLDRRKSSSIRNSRNLLHCIYAEDNIYFPLVPGNDESIGEEPKDSTDSTMSNTISRVVDSDLEKLHMSPQQSNNFSKTDEKSDEQKGDIKPKPPVAQLRQIDKLADLFIDFLSERKQIEQAEHVDNRHSTTSTVPLLPDASVKMLNSNHTFRMDASVGVEVPIPRMEASSFRSFVQKCQLRCVGLTIQELDLLFIKHRLFWFRVYEPDCPEAELGICFSAFVDLCLILSRKKFLHSLSLGPIGSNSQTKQINLTPEMRRMAISAFIEHCLDCQKEKIKIRPTNRAFVDWKNARSRENKPYIKNRVQWI